MDEMSAKDLQQDGEIPAQFIPREYKLSAPDDTVQIPLPTRKDLKWAKNIRFAASFGDLDSACKNGNLWRIQYALNTGTHINNTCGDPLAYAALNNQKEAIYLLLANDADVDVALTNGRLTPEAKDFLHMCTNISSPWHKTGEQSIMQTRFIKDSSDAYYKVQEEFNFKSRKVTIFTSKKGKELAPRSEFFRDQEVDIEIREAHAKLVELKGSPPPLEEVLAGMAHKPQTTRLNLKGLKK